MKKTIYLYLFLGLIVFSSCEGFLVEEPKSTIAPDNFYTTDAEAEAGVKGVYKLMVNLFDCDQGTAKRDLNYWTQYGTDIARPAGGREPSFPMHVYTLSEAADAPAPELWFALYQGVTNACNLIDKVSEAETLSEEVKNRVLAEAKLYRAVFYYYLTSLWGGVPYIDTFDIAYASSGLSRTSASEVRQKMIADLEATVDFLPKQSAKDYGGRPTCWAGKTMLIKYYMWEKQWKKASDLCEDIIVNSSHTILPEYGQLWGQENENNTEFIWGFDYVQNVFPQKRTTHFHPRPSDERTNDPYVKKAFAGFGLMTATNELVDSFDPNDKRRTWYKWLENDSRVDFKFNYVAKFLDDPDVVIRVNCGINIGYLRLADVYLMQAEAESELNGGPTLKAYQRINHIRQRAGIGELAGRSKEEFFVDIMNERKWELAFEFHRKLDLCRWNKLVEVVKTMSKTNPLGAELVQEHHQLLPIPVKELEKNSNLVQNPGYR